MRWGLTRVMGSSPVLWKDRRLAARAHSARRALRRGPMLAQKRPEAPGIRVERPPAAGVPADTIRFPANAPPLFGDRTASYHPLPPPPPPPPPEEPPPPLLPPLSELPELEPGGVEAALIVSPMPDRESVILPMSLPSEPALSDW